MIALLVYIIALLVFFFSPAVIMYYFFDYDLLPACLISLFGMSILDSAFEFLGFHKKLFKKVKFDGLNNYFNSTNKALAKQAEDNRKNEKRNYLISFFMALFSLTLTIIVGYIFSDHGPHFIILPAMIGFGGLAFWGCCFNIYKFFTYKPREPKKDYYA